MKIEEFIKEKVVAIILILFALITIEIFLMAYPVGNFIKIYIPTAIIVGYFIGIFFEYNSKKKYYDNLRETLDELDEKYLITEIIKTPEFIEGKILKETLEQVDKSMNENVNKYKYMQEDYKEYIELWIHEVKIPITASKLVITNNKNSITKSIDEELNKIENYIEQALYYARSNTVEKDYYIRKIQLKEIVNESIKKNKDILIQEKVEINAHDLNNVVNTDSKWVVFIINQIIQNSVKYRKKDNELKLEFYSRKGKENTKIYIKDNGIGIKEGETEKVFEKGFTGTNGRLSGKKSTGIGLYLCKKLCDKLGILIEIKSEYQKGTEIILTFPTNSYLDII
jgi:signal transduction histidine kinase